MFGAGCFWGVEDEFRGVEGVREVTVGYSGGHTENPNYEEVCRHSTGHAEVVLVEFDPSAVSYADLLKTFWEIHNPTTPNRQGWDIGDQYRSAIFTFSEEQAVTARESMAEEQKKLRDKIVTEITPAGPFYRAEEYHQRYLEKHGRASCHRR